MSDCTLWGGATYPNGYGKIYREGKRNGSKRRRRTLLAHREAYRKAYGPIATDMLIVHNYRCSGNKRCVNIQHLSPTDQAWKMRHWQARNRKTR